jgi:hypothetical protein
MSRKARSARGELVDFDLLAIKQQLAQAPAPIGVNDRRRFIDEKDGIRTKQVIETPASDALSLGIAGAAESAASE